MRGVRMRMRVAVLKLYQASENTIFVRVFYTWMYERPIGYNIFTNQFPVSYNQLLLEIKLNIRLIAGIARIARIARCVWNCNDAGVYWWISNIY